jgi:type VI secretion system VasD/TssJ family lipoprotein
MAIKRFGFEGLLAALLTSLAACSHTPPPAPTAAAPCTTPEPLRVDIQASARLNPGERGEALATVVRLYQLKGAAKLSVASFDDLLDHDREALADEFLAVQEVTVNPGDKLDPPATRNAEATHVAAVALFRQPAGTTWRAVVKLPPPDPQHCHPAPEHRDAGAPAGGGANSGSVMRISLDGNRLELR